MYTDRLPVVTKAYFENIEFHIKKYLKKAQYNVKICVAWINSKIFNSLLNELAMRGVNIEIIYNADFTNNQNFTQPSSNIKTYSIKNRFGLMHNKFCIIDNIKVITGSYNWSMKASWHFENIVIIENDFLLVKKFLHEFEDLKNYFNNLSKSKTLRCQYQESYCRAGSYNLGVMGREWGDYDESMIDIWNICFKGEHGVFLGREYEQYLQTYLGLKDDYDYDNDEIYGKDSMLEEFKRERRIIEDSQQYFEENRKLRIDAIGYVRMVNEIEHLEYGEEPQYDLLIGWKNMYKRKKIPNFIDEDFEDDWHHLISDHI